MPPPAACPYCFSSWLSLCRNIGSFSNFLQSDVRLARVLALKWSYGHAHYRWTPVQFPPVRRYWQVPKFRRNGPLPPGVGGRGGDSGGAACEFDRQIQRVSAGL